MGPMHELSSRSAARHGVLTTADLVAAGLSDRQQRRIRHDGTLTIVRRGIAVVAAVPDSERRRIVFACTATDGAASHNTAARLDGFRGVVDDGLIHITVTHDRRIRTKGLAGVVIHRTTHLPKGDIVQHADGVRTTAPWRTVFDMAASVDAATLESMVEQGVNEGWFTIAKLWDVARRLARRGRAGSGRFTRVLSARESWRRPVGSHLELRLERAVVAAGLPAPHRQHAVTLRDGQVVHPDLSWPAIRLAVEVDHMRWHGGWLDRRYDEARDRRLRLVGWEVDRVSDDDIRRRLADVAAEIAELHQLRREALGSA